MRFSMKFLPTAAGLLLAIAGFGLAFSAVSCSDSNNNNADDPAQDAADKQAAGNNKAGLFTVGVNDAKFIGGQACAKCHQDQHGQWVGSHHDQAMKTASEKSVLGNFNDTTFQHYGTTSRFFKKDGKYFVNTEGPDGKMADFEIKYTFGVEPLQQYLIEFDGGRIQALTIAWDTRPKDDGGQRWYHLYPDEDIPHDDSLHWTRTNFTWNHMCAECHSTDLHKNFDAKLKTYNTTWSEINVSCEACHGPGEKHAQWAEKFAADPSIGKGAMGLVVKLKDESRVWVMDPKTGIAKRQTPLKYDAVMDACARCHSRRSQIADGRDAGVKFLDNYMPSFLTEGLYHPDGQIQDEVYVWGSFAQSKMHMAGVSCTDCHNPHTAKVFSKTNDLCAKCHDPKKFDTSEHHFHTPGSLGASCVDCHMPHKTYMGVDPRRDHSIRVPRPDLSKKLGTPNACNQCHTEQSVDWAAEKFDFWWGQTKDGKRRVWPTHYGEVFARARKNETGIDRALLKILRDEKQPPIVRGTAVVYLARYPTRQAAEGIFEALKSKEPLIRLAAADMLRNLPQQITYKHALKALGDPARAVRLEAADALVGVPDRALSEAQQKKVKAGIAAYRKAQKVSADTAAANMNLGTLAYRLGDRASAIASYQRALEIDPMFFPAYSNLATIYADQGKPDKALTLLENALKRLPKNADLLYGRAMLYVRQKDYATALGDLRTAHNAAKDRDDIAYAYALALDQQSDTPGAIKVLDAAHAANPSNFDVLYALVTYHLKLGQKDKALAAAKKALALRPDDRSLMQLVYNLQRQQR